jgi:hypothetical protein
MSKDFTTVRRRYHVPLTGRGFPTYAISSKRAQQMRHRATRALGGDLLRGAGQW